MKKLVLTIFIAIVILLLTSANVHISESVKWTVVDTGLQMGEYTMPVKSSHGDSKLNILKIDPKLYSFHMLTASELKGSPEKAPDWAKSQKMLAVFNAGMFKLEGNFSQCTGYMKNYKHLNNPQLNAGYKNALAFNPTTSSLQPFKIIDLKCEKWDSLKNSYNSIAQGIRMIGCDGKNTWQAQTKKWSVVTVATDTDNNVLVLFCRSPYTMHDYVDMVIASPLKVNHMMYLEGGPEASLYLNHNGKIIEKNGSYETGFNENDNNSEFWDIPNVIGIQKR